MTAHQKSVLRITLSILVALILLYVAFRGSDFEKLVSSLKRANYFWVFSFVPILLISHVFRAWRWKYLLGPIKKDVSIRNLFSALMIGYMVNNFVSRIGEVVRAYTLGRLEATSKSAVLGTVLMERIIDMFSLLFFLEFILLFYKRSLGQIFPWLESASLVGSIVTAAVLGLFVLLLLRREQAFRWVGRIAGVLPRDAGRKVEKLLHSFLDGFLILKEPRQYLSIALLSVVIWFLYVVVAYLPFYAFGLVEKYSLGFNAAVVTVIISAVGVVIPAPGATGSYHWLVRETLVRLYGVEVETALSYATVTHLVNFIATILVGLYYFLRDNLRVATVRAEIEGD
jgi:uncharacterized protein (TIRG00374 family)